MHKNYWQIAAIAVFFPLAVTAADGDRDGVADGTDTCPYTLEGAQVDGLGCAVDSDADNVADGLDRCAQTTAGAAVDAGGCAADQVAATTPGAGNAAAESARTIFDVLGEPPSEPKPPAAVLEPLPPVPTSANVDAGEPRFFEVPSDPPPPAMVESAAPATVPPQTSDTAPPLPETAVAAPAPAVVTAPVVAVPALPPPGPTTAPDADAQPEMAATVAAPAQVLTDDSFSDPLYTSIYFSRGSSALTEASASKLRRSLPDLIRNVDRYPRMVVELAGHADPLSEKGDVQALGAARAQTLKAFLVERGVPSERIRTSSRGSSKPRLTHGDTGRNRRVEILTYPE